MQASAAAPSPILSGQGVSDTLVQDAKHRRLSRRPRRAPRHHSAADESAPLRAEHACAGAPLEGVEGTEDGLQVQRLVRLRRRRRGNREVGAAAAARRNRGHFLQDRGLRSLAVRGEAAVRGRGAAAGAAVGGGGGDGAEEHVGQHEEHERDVVALGWAHGLEDGARVTCETHPRWRGALVMRAVVSQKNSSNAPRWSSSLSQCVARVVLRLCRGCTVRAALHRLPDPAVQPAAETLAGVAGDDAAGGGGRGGDVAQREVDAAHV